MRVYELAKELGKTNKELLSIVTEKDASVKSHSSSLTEELANFIRSKVNAGTNTQKAESSKPIQTNVLATDKTAGKTGSDVQVKNMNKDRNKNTSKDATPVDSVEKVHDKTQEKAQAEHHAKPAVAEEKKEVKKKLTAVFRPQNAQHSGKNRPYGSKSSDGKFAHGQKRQDSKGDSAQHSHPTDKSTHSVKSDGSHSAKEAQQKMLQQAKKDGQMEISKDSKLESKELKTDLTKVTKEQNVTAQKPEGLETKSEQTKTPQANTEHTKKEEPKTIASIEHKTVDNTSSPRVNVYDNLKLQKAEPIKPIRNIFENNPRARMDATGRSNRQGQNRFSDRGDGNRNQGNRSFGENRNQGNRGGDNSRGQGQQRNADNRNQNTQRDGKRNQGNRNFTDNRNQGNRAQNNRNFGEKSFDKAHKGFMDGYDKDKESTPRSFQKQKPASKPSMDAPLTKKAAPSRLSKNQFKNQKDDKKHRNEDGPAKGGRVTKHPFIMPVKKEEAKVEDIKEIVIPALITIKDLASKLKLNASSIVKKLFLKGEILTINTEIPFEKAEEIALEYDVICTQEEVIDEVQVLTEDVEDAPETLKPRPPVVCVVGHIDHGKTSLLDAIRNTHVTQREAGGITQHIGAYMVEINGQPLTFLDTPGHEAFTSMRMRGAQSTDFAILVVAADDGVMPQTVEAINHAKAAGIEIIVAINKIDKQGVNLDRVRQELAEHELISEDWGGSTVFCEVSAKTGLGIENLLEMILLTAELKELKANPDRMARGVVIEAKLDKGKGPVATVLVQKGTLRDGNFVSAGSSFGKVRAMMDHNGKRVKKATPSTPVEIQGLDSVPNAGDILMVGDSLANVKNNAEVFKNASKDKLIEETKAKLSLNDLFSKIKEGELKELPIIIKGDVQGSVEALKQSLLKLSNEEVTVRIVHSGVGAISESDVSLAAASNTIIIGYGVRIDPLAQTRASEENVDVKLYKIIYDAINDVESAMKGMLAPVFEEKVIGTAEIRKVYKASGIGSIAGSYVTNGKIQRGCKVRISRAGELIFEGNLAGLKRFQDDVKEVASGYECGLSFEKFNDIEELDTIEAYIMVEVPRK